MESSVIVVVTEAYPVDLTDVAAVQVAEASPVPLTQRFLDWASAHGSGSVTYSESDEITPTKLAASLCLLLVMIGGMIYLFILVHQMRTDHQ